MDSDPDPRFLQANERTFLAWTRTSLAVGATALAIAGLAPVTDPAWVRPVIALTVVAFALVMMLLALKRYRATETAIMAGLPIPRLQHAGWLAAGLATVLSVAVIALLLAT